MLGKLGYKTAKDEVDDMLWEVDDDVCGYLNLANFIRMYYRIRESTIQIERRALFMLVKFPVRSIGMQYHLSMLIRLHLILVHILISITRGSTI